MRPASLPFLSALLFATGRLGVAQTTTVIAPAAPGGGWDQLARSLQEALQHESLLSRVQVENIPGAAGTIGLARFVSAQRGNPDVLLITGLVMVGGIVSNHAPVTLRETTPIARLVGEYEVIVVPASSPYRSLSALLTAFKDNPGAISWGGGSAGGTDQMLVDLIARAEGIDPGRTNYVAFAGGGEAAAAVLGAQVTAGVSGLGEFTAHIADGRVRALAVSSRERIGGVNVPTLRESGVPVDLANWRGIVAPAGILPAQRAAHISTLERLARSAHWQELLARRGWTDLWLPGDAFGRFLAAEQGRVEGLAAARGGGARSASARSAAAVYPWVVLIALALALGASLRQWRSVSAGATVRNRRALLLVLAGVALDLALVRWLGFVVAAAGLFCLTAAAFGEGRWTRVALTGFAFAAGTWLLFDRVLGVALPGGAIWAVLLP